MLFFIKFELISHSIDKQTPLFINIVVLFYLSANVALILFVVSSYLRLALLEDFNFESTFSGPLFS